MKTLTTADLERAVHTGLKDLRLPAIRACYQQKADLARRESMSFERFLLELIEQERHSNRIHRWLHQSRLPLQKTPDIFDRGQLPVWIDHHLSVLLEGGFLESRENVLALGPPGSGKTHLLCALGRELIFQRRREYNCSTLVQEILRAKRELRLPQLQSHAVMYPPVYGRRPWYRAWCTRTTAVPSREPWNKRTSLCRRSVVAVWARIAVPGPAG